MIGEEPKRKCPWCPNPEGCTSCSISGDGDSNVRSYTLVPLSMVDRMLTKARRRWMIAVAGLTGALLASLVVLSLVIYLAWASGGEARL